MSEQHNRIRSSTSTFHCRCICDLLKWLRLLSTKIYGFLLSILDQDSHAWGFVIYTGRAGLEGLSWAVVLCLVPGCLLVGLQRIVPSMSAAPHAVMLATVVRMLFVTGGVVLLRAIRPELLTMEFAACLVISYLAALAAESYYLLRLVNPVPESTQEPN